MKKIISLIFAVIISMSVLVLAFPVQKNTAKAENVDFYSESQITNKETLIGTERHNYISSVATEELNASPLNIETKEMMSGYIVSPVMDKYAQINASFVTQNVNLSENESIYMWMYFPELPLYDLQISFSASDTSVISWTFSSGTLYNMITDNGARSVYCGWKFIELSPSGSDQADQGIPFLERQIISMRITFKPSVDISYETKSERIFSTSNISLLV